MTTANHLVFWLAALELKVCAVLGCAMLLAGLLRGASARLRHVLWSAALGGTLLLPALPLILPSVPLGWLAGSFGSGPSEPLALAYPGAGPLTPASAPHVEEAGVGALETEPDSSSQAVASRWPFGAALFGLWLLGAVALFASLAASVLRVRRLAGSARVLDDESWAGPFRQAKQLVGVRRPVRLLGSEGVDVPMTAGVLWPVVLMPPEAGAWSEERRRLVLLHELTHVRRGDWLLQIAGLAAQALHWCNPLAALALRWQGASREQACDRGVVDLGAKPSVYAKHLLEIAVSISERTSAPVSALAMARRSQLEGRFMQLLTSKNPSRPGAASLILTALGMGAIVLAAGAAEPLEQSTSPLPPAVGAVQERQQAVEAGQAVPADFEQGSEFEGSSSIETGPEGDVVRHRVGHWNGNLIVERQFDDGLSVTFTAIGGRFEGPPASLEALQPGVSIHLATSFRGSTRSLTSTALGDGRIEHVWKLGEQRQPFDAPARRWAETGLAVVADLWQASSLRGKQSSLRGEISSIRGEESSLRGEISSIRGRASSLRGEISSIRGEESSLRGKISSLRASPGDHEMEIREVQRQIEALDVEGKVRGVQRQIEGLDVEGKVREVQRRIEGLDVEGKVREVQRQIEGLDVDGQIREVQRQIEKLDVEGKVREVERQIEALDADRRAREIETRMEPRVRELREILGS